LSWSGGEIDRGAPEADREAFRRTVFELPEWIWKAKRSGINCRRFQAWLIEMSAADSWGNPLLGGCANNQLGIRSAGNDWVFYTRDDPAADEEYARRLFGARK
jgi:hypothetical protein